MFIRRTTYRLKPNVKQDAFETEMRANIRPHDIEGLVSTAHVPNDDGTWTVVAVWNTKVEAMSASPRIRAEWDRQAPQLTEPPVVEAAGLGIWEAG